jgi:hypothetical protein
VILIVVNNSLNIPDNFLLSLFTRGCQLQNAITGTDDEVLLQLFDFTPDVFTTKRTGLGTHQ